MHTLAKPPTQPIPHRYNIQITFNMYTFDSNETMPYSLSGSDFVEDPPENRLPRQMTHTMISRSSNTRMMNRNRAPNNDPTMTAVRLLGRGAVLRNKLNRHAINTIKIKKSCKMNAFFVFYSCLLFYLYLTDFIIYYTTDGLAASKPTRLYCIAVEGSILALPLTLFFI